MTRLGGVSKSETKTDLPVEEILHVSDRVDLPANSQDVGVLGQQGLIDNPPLVLGFLEVRVREQEEHFGQLTLPEEIGQIFHGISPEASHVSELSRVLRSESRDFVFHIIRDLHSDLHPCHTTWLTSLHYEVSPLLLSYLSSECWETWD